ncbi:MAG: tetratricopeptide repeat protein [Thiolinea sp.]
MKRNINNKPIPRWSFACSILCVLAFSPALPAAAYTPQSDQAVITVLPDFLQTNSAEIRQFKAVLAQDPHSVEASAGLARLYIELGRTESDPRYYGYAEALLQEWWNAANPPPDILLLRATLRQHQHDYAAALQDLKQLVREQPSSSQAWLTLAVVQWVQGDYKAAKQSCSALTTQASTWYGSLCFSQVLSLTGQAERAYQLQASLLTEAANQAPGIQQWVQTNLAEIAWRLGKNAVAEQHFLKALELQHRDNYLLRVYSDFLLSEQRPEAVLSLLKDKSSDDALLLRLALASQQVQQSEQTQIYREQLKARYAAARLRNSSLHQRDEALYLLSFESDKQAALALAKSNWAEQKEAEDTALLLRAALANQDWATAREVQAWLQQTKQQDARFESYLAQIPAEKAS